VQLTADITVSQLEAIQSLQQVEIDRTKERADEIKDHREKMLSQLDKEKQVNADRIAADLEAGRITQAMADKSLAALDANYAEQAKIVNKQHKDKLKAQEEAALKAFKLQKGIAMAQVIAEAIAATMAMTVFFAPMLGPAAPLAAAAAMALPTTAAIVSVQSMQPPEFPTGRSPDHSMLAAVQPDEAILSRRGVANAGGKAAIDALNTGGSAGMLRVDLKFGQKTLETVMIDTLKRPAAGSAVRRAAGVSRATPGRKTR